MFYWLTKDYYYSNVGRFESCNVLGTNYQLQTTNWQLQTDSLLARILYIRNITTFQPLTFQQTALTSTYHSKHEIIACERCGTAIECKANAYTKCQCSTVQLTINEVQHISELYDGCLCAKCLGELKQEYWELIGNS